MLVCASLQGVAAYSEAAKHDAPLPPEVEAAKQAAIMPGPDAGWHFQPLFKPEVLATDRPRRQLP